MSEAKCRWLLLAGAVAAAAAAFWAKAHSPSTAYLDGRGWIVPGLVKNAGECPRVPTRVTFSRPLDLPAAVAGAVFELRTMGAYEVLLDDAVVEGGPWDAPVVSRERRRVSLPELGVGDHVLAVRVRAVEGPVALTARLLDGDGNVLLRTDPAWSYEINGSAPAPARRASDPWIGVAYDTDDLEPLVVWGHSGVTWGVAALSLLAILLARRRGVERPLSSRTPLWFLAGLAATWVVLLALAAKDINDWWGYDLEGHVAYLDWVRTRGTLPYPTDGWQMYQPPLYYVAAAGILRAIGVTASSPAALRAIAAWNGALAAGFLVAGAFAIGRFVGRRTATWAIGVLFLGTTPMAFYLYAYPTNENLCTFLASLVLFALAGLRGRRIDSLPAAAGLGALLGLALLSKATALLLVVPVAIAYLLRALGRRSWRPLAGLGVAISAAVAVSGWFFVRTWMKLGKPIVGNWDPASRQEWWQLPGYRTWGSYLFDVHLFRRPFYAGLDSVWSGFLSTWAGDTLSGGNANVNIRPPWNYELTPVSIALCVVLATLTVVGIVSRVRWKSLRMPRRDACLLSLLVVTVLTLLWMTLTVPAYAQAKAFYGLVAIVPLVVFAARGARKVWGAAVETPRGLVLLAAPWVVVFVATFVVVPRADHLTPRALALNMDGRRDEAIATLADAVERDAGDWNARVMLATLLLDDPEMEPKVRTLIDANHLVSGPFLPRRLDLAAQLELRAGRAHEAVRLARRAIALAPERPRFWVHGMEALRQAGDPAGAEAMQREALRWHPWEPPFPVP
ncbi:MAG TPA: bacterial transcriptional activator domain-containing protein [Candidatus Polarisedimenticolaceae bacterium]|nr:bacterial transcriptional activator domain-containing protein [Candidatus Polarisedimenticolaceae bacterium]